MSTKALNEESTALEVIEGHDLTGYNIMVTGSNSGIGVETVRAFAKAGANCYMTVRDIEKSQSVADEIKASTGNNNIFLDQLELDSLESVNAFVERFLAKNIPLHILVNNAGVMCCPLSYTRDGNEMQFGTNHVGHFALTLGLIPALKKGVAESGRNARVVVVSSVSHSSSDFCFEDYQFKEREYDPMVSYGQSKTANCLFSIAFNERFAKDNIFSNSLMPGIIRTNLMRHMPSLNDMIDQMKMKTKTIEQGAATTVWAAVAKELEGKGGLYLENCGISEESTDQAQVYKDMRGYLSHITDKKKADKLWELSEKLIKRA